MTLIALASAKGSPGVTTAALALARAWPAGQPVLVAELDPAGGDLGPRLGLGADPGLVSLAAAARRQVADSLLFEHAQPLVGEAAVLVGPGAAEQAHAALASTARKLAAALVATASPVLADCGRLDPGSPALEVALGAQVVALFARPTVEQVRHLRPRVSALQAAGCRVGLVLVGERPYPHDEVASVVGAEVLGVLAEDPRGASLVSRLTGDGRWVARSGLMRSATQVASALAPYSSSASPTAAQDAVSANGLARRGGALQAEVRR